MLPDDMAPELGEPDDIAPALLEPFAFLLCEALLDFAALPEAALPDDMEPVDIELAVPPAVEFDGEPV